MRPGRFATWLVTQAIAQAVLRLGVVAVLTFIVSQHVDAQALSALFAPPVQQQAVIENLEPVALPAIDSEVSSPVTAGDIFAPPLSTNFLGTSLQVEETPLLAEVPVIRESAPEPLPTPDIADTNPHQKLNLFSSPLALVGPSEYELSLLEAVRIGLEQSKEVVVLSFDPSVDATLIETTKSEFDPVAGAAAYGGQSDVQVRSEIQSFGSLADFLDTNFLRPFNQPNNLYLRRNLISGGQAELGFSSDYEDYFPPGDQLIVNPGWDSALNFRFDQPLMRGRGTDSSLAPLKIAQAKYKQSRYVFMGEIRDLSRDIELTYWEFAGAERSHKVVQQLLAQVDKLLQQESRRAELGQSALPNVLQVRSLYEEFRVLELERAQQRDIAESRLRQIMGIDLCIPTEGDASSVMVSLNCLPLAATDDGSTDSAVQPLEATLPFALQRPEVMAQRAVVSAAQIDLCRARNDLQPDVFARVNYSVNGLDENLGQSIRTIARHEYKTWSVGLIYERPFGQRSDKADLDRTELVVSQEMARLNQIEYDISHALRRAEDNLRSAENILIGQEKRVVVAQEQLDAYSALYQEGRVDIFLRVESERTLATAKLALVEAWRNKQLAVAQRNYEANLASPAFEFAPADD